MKKILFIIYTCLVAYSASAADAKYVNADIYVHYFFWDIGEVGAYSKSDFDPYIVKEANIEFKNLFGFELLLNYLSDKLLSGMDFKKSDESQIFNDKDQLMQGLAGAISYNLFDNGRTSFTVGLTGSAKKFKGNIILFRSMPFYSEDGSFTVIDDGDSINYSPFIQEYRINLALKGEDGLICIYLGKYQTDTLRGLTFDTSYTETKDDVLLPYALVTMERNEYIMTGFSGDLGSNRKSDGFGFVIRTIMDFSIQSKSSSAIYSKKESNSLIRFAFSPGFSYRFGENVYIELGVSAEMNWFLERIDLGGEIEQDIVLWNTETNVVEKVDKGTKIVIQDPAFMDFLYGPYFKITLSF